jgi:hypothetical protein
VFAVTAVVIVDVGIVVLKEEIEVPEVPEETGSCCSL